MLGKKNVYIIADNILSPLGNTTEQNFEQIKNGVSGIATHYNEQISAQPLSAALFEKGKAFAVDSTQYTKFEQLLISSIKDALGNAAIKLSDPKTGLIISSTKGNITLLETGENNASLQSRISLNTSASLVASYFGAVSEPIIISNACVSGVMAIITGMRLIQSGKYDNIVICGSDVVSKFVVSGFQSFQALSQERCKPFDKNRKGLNLGEAAATLILSGDDKYAGSVRVTGGSITNDANHISGPSRTGQELSEAIDKAISEAAITAKEIGAIVAHGTATSYNDDMEANALTLSGLQNVPVSSLKGFYGHTLGAAGLIESVLLKKIMETEILLPTLGFEHAGTKPLNIVKMPENKTVTHGVKTASGFGGCNAALVLSK